ncbi:gap junction delta-3 protein-like [Engraulis encrasicolus]|uniref:gap junction delta-3 protein-like n=1 Tax=Engraulis encrasicolus TaxID=184585 RepID=UPI002FD22D0F
MADWGFLGELFEAMQTHSPLLGRLWLQIMLVFRMLILGTVASDLFEDEQDQFECNTAQPGCKQVCYDQAFPISQYRFWVFHIVLISTPALLFLMYSVHLRSKMHTCHQVSAGMALPGKAPLDMVDELQELRVARLYMLNVGFRFLAELAFLLGQWALYGFEVAAQYPCSRFPCPYTVDCFTSRPMEKTIFLCFYFAVGLLSALFSLAELLHVFHKWRRRRRGWKSRSGAAGMGTGTSLDEEMGGTGEEWRRRGALQTLPMIAGDGVGGGAAGLRGVGDAGVLGFQRGQTGAGGGKEGGKRGQGHPGRGSGSRGIGRGIGRGRSGGSSASGGWGKGRRSSGSSASSRIVSSATRKSTPAGSQKLDTLMV